MSTRRRFIVAGAAATGAALGWTLTVPDWGPRILDDGASGLGPQVDALLKSWRGSAQLGQAIVTFEGASQTRQKRADRLLARFAASGGVPDTEAALRTLFAEDFARNDLCTIDGWILSRTECDWAALRFEIHGGSEPETETSDIAGQVAEVTNWGPRETEVGRKFNVQSDGHSGIWFAARGAPSWIKVRIDGVEMPTFVTENNVTSGLHGALQERIISTPGEYPIEFVDSMSRTTQLVGHLKVSPPHPRHVHQDGKVSLEFCQVAAFGPDRVRAGINPNPQPDGSFGIWVRTPCVPPSTRILLDGRALETTLGTTAVTARAPMAAIASAPARLKLALRDMITGEPIEVGEIIVEPAPSGK